MERQLEPKLELGFSIAQEFRSELLRLWRNCLDTRDRGMEYRMDHGIALREMKDFLKQFDEIKQASGFTRVCQLLEIEVAEANRRMRMSDTWTLIKYHLEDRGLSTPLPRNEAHLLVLSEEVETTQIGETWVKIYHSAEEARIPITARFIKEWVANNKALPAPNLEPELGEGEVEEGEAQEEPELEPESEQPKTRARSKAPGSGPDFNRPPGLEDAVSRIIRLCAGTNASQEALASWQAALSGDRIRIKFDAIMRWDAHTDDDVRKIGRLWSASERGLETAIRVVDAVIDDDSRISQLKSRCLAEGYRFEHIDGPFRLVITFTK